MSETPVGIYTIGQTPRPDLTANLTGGLRSCRLELRGALDDLPRDRIPSRRAGDYPLETLLRDGTRVVVGADSVRPRLQEAIDDMDDRVRAHLVLCAGPFPGLTARKPLVLPFDNAVIEMWDRGFRSMEVVVPFVAQAGPAGHKWEAAGFSCRIHVLEEKPEAPPLGRWLADRLAGSPNEVILFDYVGFPKTLLEQVQAEVGIPVHDAGHLAVESLEKTLSADEDRRTER